MYKLRTKWQRHDFSFRNCVFRRLYTQLRVSLVVLLVNNNGTGNIHSTLEVDFSPHSVPSYTYIKVWVLACLARGPLHRSPMPPFKRPHRDVPLQRGCGPVFRDQRDADSRWPSIGDQWPIDAVACFNRFLSKDMRRLYTLPYRVLSDVELLRYEDADI